MTQTNSIVRPRIFPWAGVLSLTLMAGLLAGCMTPSPYGPRAEVMAQFAKRAAPAQPQPGQQNVVTLSPAPGAMP